MKLDSEFLCSHCLIDYSIFLLQIDRNMMISNMNLTTPMITFSEKDGFVVVMNKALEAFATPEIAEKPRAKSFAASKFKKAVFNVVESNEEAKHDIGGN